MKCTVVFRADFRQPKEVSMKLPGAVSVEVYHAKVGPPSEWRARRPGTKIDFRIASQNAPSTLQRQIELLHFESRLTEWEAFDTAYTPPRKLSAADWKADKDGKIFLVTA